MVSSFWNSVPLGVELTPVAQKTAFDSLSNPAEWPGNRLSQISGFVLKFAKMPGSAEATWRDAQKCKTADINLYLIPELTTRSGGRFREKPLQGLLNYIAGVSKRHVPT